MKTIPLVRPPQSANLKSAKIILFPGEEIGEHVTENREEIIIVLRGKGILIKGTESFEIEENSVHYVGKGVKHNVRNYSDEEMEYIYVVALE